MLTERAPYAQTAHHGPVEANHSSTTPLDSGVTSKSRDHPSALHELEFWERTRQSTGVGQQVVRRRGRVLQQANEIPVQGVGIVIGVGHGVGDILAQAQ